MRRLTLAAVCCSSSPRSTAQTQKPPCALAGRRSRAVTRRRAAAVTLQRTKASTGPRWGCGGELAVVEGWKRLAWPDLQPPAPPRPAPGSSDGGCRPPSASWNSPSNDIGHPDRESRLSLMLPDGASCMCECMCFPSARSVVAFLILLDWKNIANMV